MKMPPNIALSIDRNRHKVYYQSVAGYVASAGVNIGADDLAKAIESDELWEVQWHPDTPVGSCSVAAATYERAMELANEP